MYLKSNLWLFFCKLSAFWMLAWTTQSIKYSEHNFNIPYFPHQRWFSCKAMEERKNKFIVLRKVLSRMVNVLEGQEDDVIADTHKMEIKIWF